MTREYPNDDPMKSVIVRVRECSHCPRLVESIEIISDGNRSVKWLPKERPKWLRKRLRRVGEWISSIVL
jgi:hypothetical protein